jgi:hypothetical protein
VQLGTGMHGVDEPTKKRSGWLSKLLGSSDKDLTFDRELLTSVPLKIAAEKLKGFVSDHHAEIIEIKENRVRLKIDGPYTPLLRRKSDRPVPFLMDLEFHERNVENEGRKPGTTLRTGIRVIIRPSRKRDRRRNDVQHRSLQLLASLKSYFMAHETSPDAEARAKIRSEAEKDKDLFTSALEQGFPAGE